MNAPAYTNQPNRALIQLGVSAMMKSHAITVNSTTNSSASCGARCALSCRYQSFSASSPFQLAVPFSYAGFSSGAT